MPIHTAAQYGFSDAVALLAGGGYEQLNDESQSPLHIAAKYGQVDFCRALLDTGLVDVNIEGAN